MSYLEVKNVTHHFFKEQQVATALEDVNFTVNSGEFVSFLGPSGCGKSTLLSLLAGLLKPTTGSIDFAESDVEIGYMLQQDFLFPWKTIEDNVALGLKLLKKKKITRLLMNCSNNSNWPIRKSFIRRSFQGNAPTYCACPYTRREANITFA